MQANPALDRPMILLADVVQIFPLTDPDGRFCTRRGWLFKVQQIGLALIDHHRFGHTIVDRRFSEITVESPAAL